jgi:O-acetylserine/cysteine efflux transporter
MNYTRRPALAALTAAGLLWGTTVPLSKVALEWLPPGWLTCVRFGLAAAVLLTVAGSRVRAACSPAVLASGAIGYGGSVVLQNAGITRTSVSHAALLIGAAPVLVAVIAALWHHTVARPVAWAGFAVSLGGVGLIAGGGGGGATLRGDGLVLASLVVMSTFTVAQGRLLRGRDPVAVTAVQFMAAALATMPFAVFSEGIPAAPGGPALLATIGLAAGGTLLPFTFFAYGQSRVSAEVAGAFLNLEPLVGATAGAIVFGDPVGPRQALGGAAILAGIALSSLPLLAARRHREPPRPPRAMSYRTGRPAVTIPSDTAGNLGGKHGVAPWAGVRAEPDDDHEICERDQAGPAGGDRCSGGAGRQPGRLRWLVRVGGRRRNAGCVGIRQFSRLGQRHGLGVRGAVRRHRGTIRPRSPGQVRARPGQLRPDEHAGHRAVLPGQDGERGRGHRRGAAGPLQQRVAGPAVGHPRV